MNASRAALMVVGVNLVAVWAAAAAGSRTAPAAPPTTPQMMTEQAVEEARTSLLASAELLEAHARREIPPASARDPFRFGDGARPAARHGAETPHAGLPSDAPVTAAAPAVEPEPDIVLQGMAESTEGDTTVRTAILHVGSELVLASLGTRVGDRFEVVALTADSVELEDVTAHVRRTWRMK